jgi:C4-type Zn-finger protein
MPDKDKPVTATEAVALKRCPFCGRQVFLMTFASDDTPLFGTVCEDERMVFVECECGIGTASDTIDKVAEMWNRRVGEQEAYNA